MTKTVVITRAKGDELGLTETLHDLGYRTIHEALTEVFLKHTVRAELHDEIMREPDAIIITSRYGARALASLNEMRDMPVLTVGEATADAALSAGFTRVVTGGGTSEELATYIIDAYDSDARFLYISAEHVRTDLKELLAPHGTEIKRIAAYEAVPAPALSDTLTEQLKRGQIDAITFLSQRTAWIFAELLKKTDAGDATSALHAIALSEAVAKPLQALSWRALHSAAEPTLASLVDCVDNALR
jgi:uroporphyrinogen-III synthase